MEKEAVVKAAPVKESPPSGAQQSVLKLKLGEISHELPLFSPPAWKNYGIWETYSINATGITVDKIVRSVCCNNNNNNRRGKCCTLLLACWCVYCDANALVGSGRQQPSPLINGFLVVAGVSLA